ncbi:Glycine/D-amino acid oxidase [Formosa sp. Hel1_31_208]|uniref:NAD(P)/FAD-dependent oxidoreductase n=1 Tax=Formosa sp. Hel1_31_208 TaxID=1798225 RepID=UPI000879C294|nr:FAD-dependent oxidoreductase [Formosa sp. Hel1_31_208]SDR97441.1 Glycine/D-amino acid oxidase [Formosa sp. Hel1_31_208]
MKNVDYIIVGCGLAGIAFCEELRQNNKSFIVFDNNSQHSSKVAAGLYNPVILKRFTKVWNAKSQLELALPKYVILERLLKTKLNYQLPVYRKFASIEEQNEWFIASDKPILGDFLSTTLIPNKNPHINAQYGFGEVLHSGRIHTTHLVTSYIDYLKSQDQFYNIGFEYEALVIKPHQKTYRNVTANHIVFAEGYGLSNNPFFNYLPLNGTKGEMLTIKAPDLKIDFILKSSVFVVPLENDLYWIGATYEREDKTHSISEKAKIDLLQKVKQIINCDFEVVSQVAGIRPTTRDRRPLVGEHPIHKNMYVLNGLGTRGVMISPYVAQQLFNHIEEGNHLDPEINISRFNT